MLHKQLTLIVISILWLLNPTIVVGSEFMDWVDSITYCPECLSHTQPLTRSNGGDSVTFPTEERGIRSSSLPTCADDTPDGLKTGDINEAGRWIRADIGGNVNGDTDSSSQVTQVTEADDVDTSVPTELASLIDKKATVTLVDQTQNNMGVVTKCDSSGDIQFASSSGGKPSTRSGKARGVIVIPPNCPKKMASQRSVRSAFANGGIKTNNCTVCNDTTSVFVRKQEFVTTVAQVFQKSTSELYSGGIIPTAWQGKTERLYKDELDKVMPGIIQACRKAGKCPPTGGDGGREKSNRFFNCAENLYPDYFPGPVQTEELPYNGITLYLRSYTLYQCGQCGFASESSLATYQSDAYYAFDNDWQYLDSLDNVLYSFCPGW